MKKAALLLGIVLISAAPAWCYRFDCSRSCSSSCGPDLLCQIQCHTCCPATVVKNGYLCAACQGSWDGNGCSGQGVEATPAAASMPTAPAAAAPPHSDVGGGYEEVDVIRFR